MRVTQVCVRIQWRDLAKSRTHTKNYVAVLLTFQVSSGTSKPLMISHGVQLSIQRTISRGTGPVLPSFKETSNEPECCRHPFPRTEGLKLGVTDGSQGARSSQRSGQILLQRSSRACWSGRAGSVCAPPPSRPRVPIVPGCQVGGGKPRRTSPAWKRLVRL